MASASSLGWGRFGGREQVDRGKEGLSEEEDEPWGAWPSAGAWLGLGVSCEWRV